MGQTALCPLPSRRQVVNQLRWAVHYHTAHSSVSSDKTPGADGALCGIGWGQDVELGIVLHSLSGEEVAACLPAGQ